LSFTPVAGLIFETKIESFFLESFFLESFFLEQHYAGSMINFFDTLPQAQSRDTN